jgi:uncharacterized membrane protein YphA (DoxX/SURF4 family)
MSLISILAENSEYLNYLQNDEIRKMFEKISGNYKVLRFEIGNDKQLKDIVFAQIVGGLFIIFGFQTRLATIVLLPILYSPYYSYIHC